MTQELTEAKVTELWQYVAKDGTSLSTVDERVVRVVYPGRPSDEPGADFKDAVLSIGGRLTKGDIEIHVRSSDWRTHCHHRNKTYNGIVLHVVMWHDAEDVTRLENGCSVPVISLSNQRTMAITRRETKPSLPYCAGSAGGISEEKIVAVLDCAGEARFREKQSVFCRGLEYTDAGQCLYRGVMGALGYSRNIVPFQILAEQLPLASLESVAQETLEESALARLEALLLGTAGFLPSQRVDTLLSTCDEEWTQAVERDWRVSQRQPALSTTDWRLFRVRPGNFPLRRLAGMARLLWQYRRRGLLAGLVELVKQTSPDDGWCQVEAGLMVKADGYWADRFDLGKQCRGLDQFLIGRSRAKEIIVNVLFPFIAASGEGDCQPGIGEKVFELYCDYPPAAENTIERHMRVQLGVKRALLNSARRQQGLLHLYKRFCTQGRCGECPLVI
ncbi:MAG: DUF2851 family protein [Dehalococcoidales bacterium]|nr:DUF2851 family protein [Dehalococcoidales bacterium]